MDDEQVTTVTHANALKACEHSYAAGLLVGLFGTLSFALLLQCSFVGCILSGLITFVVIKYFPDCARDWIAGKFSAVAVLALLITPTGAQAGNCNQFFYPQQVVAVPVVAAPVYYQAGRDIESEAFLEKVARLVEPRVIEKLGGEQLKADLAAVRSQAKAETLTKPTAKSAVAEHCAKCHSGAAPKGGVVLDGDTPINGEQLGDSLTALSDDSMPKDHKISPEVKGKLMAELLALEKRSRIRPE